MNKLFAIVIFVVSSNFAQAAGTITGKIHSIQARESGYIEITFEETHSNPDECGQAKKVVIPPTHVAKDEIVSFSLAAMAQGKTSAYYVLGCYEQYNTSYPIALTGAIKNN
ncbi:hypothetical protein FLL45_17530 [Aliikangiella marina]|uniref:Uncharacterized protein n=1 Tax=Aliikangiella marina TaxID=1712262 RepID=A0A545T4A4_9GAMM|nr:hypothetical protein [Aliikangiella marina]TQV71972.1 hypothetical protein FLL45_17250 [Aliikangiella marina]TQV72025.1 hypothetical protein FLL45_17530 [Aliikangiella marina]